MPSCSAGRAFRIGVVADDLTGAGDTGVQFAKRGWMTYVFSPGSFIREIEVPRRRREFASIPVVVINTASRNLAPREAYRRARVAFSVVRDRELLYKKVDSTLRGNIGREIDAAMDATGRERALFSAAYPSYGRITIGGVHYLGKAELSSTEATRDPKAPVTDSQVCRIISRQSKRRVARLDNCGSTGDLARLGADLEGSFRSGNEVLACDAQSDRDLEALARVALGFEKKPLLAGSAGLAAQLARLLPAPESARVRPLAAGKRDGVVLVVSGSASAKNEGQLRHLAVSPNTRLLALTPEQLLRRTRGARQERTSVSRSLGRLLEQGGVVVLAVRPAASRQEPPAGDISTALAALLAPLLRRHHQELKGLVLTGGETAERLLGSLKAKGLWLEAEVEPGIPVGLVEGGCLKGLPVITKAGSLGSEGALSLSAQYLESL